MENLAGKNIPANYMKGREGVGGKIYFDEYGMVFKSHNFNFQTGVTGIPYDQIVGVIKRNSLGVVPNGILVLERGNIEHKFVVKNRENVIEFIKSRMSTR